MSNVGQRKGRVSLFGEEEQDLQRPAPPETAHTTARNAAPRQTAVRTRKKTAISPRRTRASVSAATPRRTQSRAGSARRSSRRLYIPWKRLARKAGRRLALFGVLFAALFVITGGILLLRIYTGNTPREISYRYRIGATADASVSTVSSRRIFRNGTTYLNINSLISFCELTEAGDVNAIRYISRTAADESVCFTPGLPIITVNRVPVRLSAPVIAEGDALWIPIEFFERYMNGVSVTLDTDAHEITFTRLALPTTEETDAPILRPITFTVRKAQVSPNITEESLGKDLLYETDPLRIAAEKELARIREEEARRAAEEQAQAAAAAGQN